MAKKTYEVKSTRYDGSTGEVHETTSYSVKPIDNEDAFIKVYFKDVALTHGLRSKETDLLWEVLVRVGYDNQVSLPVAVKEDICRVLKIFKLGTEEPSLNSFNVSFSRIIKRGLLHRIGSGLYMPNPMLFARGKWSDIREIRLKLTYNKLGREVKSEIE